MTETASEPTITSATTSLVGEMQELPGLKDILTIIDESQLAVDDFIAGAEALQDQALKTGAEKVGLIEEKGENDQIIAGQKLVSELQTQEGIRALFETAGGAEMLTQLNEAQHVANRALLREQQEMADNRAYEFDISDPFGWIGNEIEMYFNEKELASATTRVGNVNAAITGFAATTTANSQILSATEEKLNKGTIAAETENLAIATQIQASEAELESVRTNAAAYKTIVEARGAQFDTMYKGMQARNTEENQEMARKRYDKSMIELDLRVKNAIETRKIQRAQLDAANLRLEHDRLKFPLEVERLQLQRDEIKRQVERQAQADDTLVAGVNRGRAIMKLPAMERSAILGNFDLGGTVAARMIDLTTMGLEGSDIIGATPAETVKRLQVHAKDQLIDSPNPAMRAIADVVSNIDLKDTATGTKRTQAQLDSTRNAAIKTRFDTDAAEISYTDKDNPYSPPPMGVIEQFASVQETPFYQKVLKDMGLKEVNPKQLMELATTAMVSKQVSPEEAAGGIVAIFKAVGASNNAQHEFERLGLPEQTSFNTKLTVKGQLLDTRKIVDLQDVTEVKLHLITNSASTGELLRLPTPLSAFNYFQDASAAATDGPEDTGEAPFNPRAGRRAADTTTTRGDDQR